jgi:hypothetical protein
MDLPDGVTPQQWLDALTRGVREGTTDAWNKAFEDQPLETYRSAGNLIADAIADGTREAFNGRP